MIKTCAVCLAELECPNCVLKKDSLADIEKFEPLGWITDETLKWIKDPNARGPGMFTANRNGQGGVWAIYSGSDFQRLYILAESLKYELDEYTRGEREHLLRCKAIVKDLLAWYDNGARTMRELDRIYDIASDLVQR
jgi:hypothetical protein